MSDRLASPEETPTLEVRVFRDGRLIHRALCESEEQAALEVESWSELDGVTCDITDLSTPRSPDDVLALDAHDIVIEEEYPTEAERRPAWDA